MEKRIHYGNATQEQRQQIGEFIRRDLGSCQSSLVDMLLSRGDVDGFTYDEIENAFVAVCPECGEQTETEDGEPAPGCTCLGDQAAGLDRAAIVELLKSATIECGEDEDLDTLREALRVNLQDGTIELDIKPVSDWETDLRDIFEWWPVDFTTAGRLREIGEPILDNDFGIWWGRTCTGQSVILDPTFWTIYQDAII